MIEFVRFGFGLLLVPISLVYFRLGDPLLIYIVVGGFFSGSIQRMVASIFFFGIVLDLFTPYFGYHLITYTSVYLLTVYVAQHLLTTKSLVSLLIMVLVATLIAAIFSIAIMALYSLGGIGGYLFDFLYTLKQLALTAVINVSLALLYYMYTRKTSFS
ncbi:hypothetical protein HY620_01425 [Candidatus Uhrbacteria bacterium]|nr:hypothetical protein [Candidatus Uhrbacteria bacterium]